MKRLFWVGVGVAVGITATRKVNELTQKATPSGIGTSLGEGLRELGAGLGAFGAEVRAGMNERSEELYAMVEDTTEIPVRPDASPSARHARAPRRGASHAR
jgi:hypothetical protein